MISWILFINKGHLKVISMIPLQVLVMLDWLHDQGPWPGKDYAVPIMNDIPNIVDLLINIYYHPFLCK